MRIGILLTSMLCAYPLLVVSFQLFSNLNDPFEDEFPAEYGVDVTAPIHHYLDQRSYFGKRYDKMITG